MRRRRGFTLIELAIVMAVLAALTAAVAPVAIRQVEIRYAQRCGREMAAIQDAAKWYYVDTRSWPPDLATLRAQGYLHSAWGEATPWGTPYQLASTPTTLSVSATVPEGVAGVVSQLVVAPVVADAGGGQRTVTSTIAVPGREVALSDYVRRTGDTMTGPLMLNNTYLGWQRDGTTQWTAGLDGLDFSVKDGGGAERWRTSRATGETALSRVSSPSATIGSLSGTAASWSGTISARDMWIASIGHWASQANF
jgi:prepilin-type N-terminal cleavage/methylation domain-containing protein